MTKQQHQRIARAAGVVAIAGLAPTAEEMDQWRAFRRWRGDSEGQGEEPTTPSPRSYPPHE
jgi:hypothetical protein